MKPIFPQLAQTAPVKSDSLKKYECGYIAQEKLDGTRCVTVKIGDAVIMMTRTWKNDMAPLYPEIVSDIRKIHGDIILDGELMFYTKDTHIPKFIGSAHSVLPETGLPYDAYYMVYDLLQFGDTNCRNSGNSDRLTTLHNIIASASTKFVCDLPIITDDFGAFFDNIIAKGGEGIILKDRFAPYKEDARPTYWLKVKKEETHDCFILGIDKGNGKYSGLFGALIVGQIVGGKVEMVAKVSGMTDETRLQLYRTIMGLPDAKTPLKIKDAIKQVDPNMVIEVECMERLKSGFMRHPRFLRSRDDKTWQQCIME